MAEVDQAVVTLPQFRVTTTDATVTTCGSYTMPDEASGRVIATIMGRQSASTNANVYVLMAGFKRETGTLSIVGAVTNPLYVENDSTWDATIDASGNDIRVRVTGVAATTILWQATIEVIVFKP